MAAWASEAALLLMSFAVYFAVVGNFLEAAIILPIALIVTYFQYRFANLTVTKRMPPRQ